MSTVNNVPAVLLATEILAEIFELCLPIRDSRDVTRYRLLDAHPLRPSEAPLLVASICQRWCNVAISTPQLWLGPLKFAASRRNHSVISLWLARSQPYPLSFAMEEPFHSRSDSSYRKTVEQLNRHCERWDVVEVGVAEDASSVFDQVRGRLPCLRKLCLQIDSAHPVESFQDAPLLTEVYLISGSTSGFTVLLPWTQLTKLTCNDLTDTECLQVLRHCSSLAECFLIGFETRRSRASILSSPIIIHHHLTSFRIEGPSTLDTLRCLELPALRFLQLELEYGDPESDADILHSFLTQSRCQLEHISLWHIDAQALIQSLPLLSSLVTLEVRTYKQFLIADILMRFTFDLLVLPNLKKLDMDIVLDYEVFSEADRLLIQQMILTRCCGFKGRNVLDTFRLIYKPAPYDVDATRLMELAVELEPLLAPRMVEFKISDRSDLWG